jgi:hypothetical protein
MTQKLPFTRSNLRKRIAAAHEAGLVITAISPDGTLLLTAVDRPELIEQGQENAPKASG